MIPEISKKIGFLKKFFLRMEIRDNLLELF